MKSGQCRRRRVVQTKCTIEPARDARSGSPRPRCARRAVRRSAAVPRRSRRRARVTRSGLRPRDAEVRDQHRRRNPPRDMQRLLGLAHCVGARLDRRSPAAIRPAPACEPPAVGAECCALEPRFAEPLLEIRHRRRCGSRSASASRRPRRTRPIPRSRQVIGTGAERGRGAWRPELAFTHKPNSLCYSRAFFGVRSQPWPTALGEQDAPDSDDLVPKPLDIGR